MLGEAFMPWLDVHVGNLPSSARFNTVCTRSFISRLPGINTLKMICFTRPCKSVNEIMKPVPVRSASDVFCRVSVCIANTKNGARTKPVKVAADIEMTSAHKLFCKWVSVFEPRLIVLLSSINDLGVAAVAAKSAIYIDTDCHDFPKARSFIKLYKTEICNYGVICCLRGVSDVVWDRTEPCCCNHCWSTEVTSCSCCSSPPDAV